MKRTVSTMGQEVETVKAITKGRRYLLNANKLTGRNLRQFLSDRQVDWLSLDDVLFVLEEGIFEQAKQLQRAITKDPTHLDESSSPRAQGEDEDGSWVSEAGGEGVSPSQVRKSHRRGEKKSDDTASFANPIMAEEDDETE